MSKLPANHPIQVALPSWLSASGLVVIFLSLFFLFIASAAWGQSVGSTSLQSPADLGATGTAPTFSWSSASGANRYYIIVAENRSLIQDISSNNLSTCRNGSGANRGCVISYLATTNNHTARSYSGNQGWSGFLGVGKQYFWAVQPYIHGGQDGPWTAIRSFSTIPTVTTTMPSANELGTAVAPTFQWQSAAGATKYWLVVADDSGKLPQNPWSSECGSNCKISQNVTGLSFTANPTDLQPDTVYFWRVQGYKPPTNGNPIANGKWGDIQWFRTKAVSSSYRLSINLTGSGGGRVTSSDDKINCPDGKCFANYQSGNVTLTAIADNGSNFSGWSGGGCSGVRACVVNMNADKSVSAVFDTVSTDVALFLEISGLGRVTGSGVDCRGGCTTSHARDSELSLTFIPDDGHKVGNFSGCNQGGSSNINGTVTCNLLFDTDRTVSVVFESAGGGADTGWLTFPASGNKSPYSSVITAALDHPKNPTVIRSSWKFQASSGNRKDKFVKFFTGESGAATSQIKDTSIWEADVKYNNPIFGWYALTDKKLSYDGHQGYDFSVGERNQDKGARFRTLNGSVVKIQSAATGKIAAYRFSCTGSGESCTRKYNYCPNLSERQTPDAYQAGLGNFVEIAHEINSAKYHTLYAHLAFSGDIYEDKREEIENAQEQVISLCNNGVDISSGSILGAMGASGSVTAPHLHFEVRDVSGQTDPGRPNSYSNTFIVDPYVGLKCSVQKKSGECVQLVGVKGDSWSDEYDPTPQNLPTSSSTNTSKSSISSLNRKAVRVSISGQGKIISLFPSIDCTENGGTCEAGFSSNIQLLLTAKPASNFEIAGWGGDCAGTTGSVCSIGMDAARSVSASFRARSNPIPAPLQVSPVAGVIDAQSDTFFQWQIVSRAERYWLVVADSPNKLPDHPNDSSCPSCVISAVVGQNQHTAGQSSELLLGRTKPLDPGKTYYWRAQGYQRLASGGTNDGDWSPILSFRVRNPGQMYVVTVSRSGANGGGFVISEPPGISCGDTCSAPFAEGQAITLTAISDDGLYFDGWDGDCAGQSGNSCLLSSITGPQSVTARFKTGEPALNGSITTIITPAAAIAVGAKWRIAGQTGWLESGATAGGLVAGTWDVEFSAIIGWTTPLVVHVPVTAENPNRTASRAYERVVEPGALVNVVFEGDGWGEIRFSGSTSTPYCTSDCSVRIPTASTVRVLADVGGGSIFGGWTGPCTATGGTDPNLYCDLDMRGGDQTVRVRFDQNPDATERTLVVDVRSFDQLGAGKVVVSPEGMECQTGQRCSTTLPDQTNVTMSFWPEENSDLIAGYREGTQYITRWRRNPSVSYGTTLSGDEVWIFEFVDEGTRPVTYFPINSNGKTVINQTFRDCSPDSGRCRDWFPSGTQFRLVADPDPDWEFRNWEAAGVRSEGTCDFTKNPCEFTVNPGRDEYGVFPHFWENPVTLTLTVSGPGRVTWRDDQNVDYECRDTCEITLQEGQRLRYLSPRPDVNGKFVEWGGLCAGQFRCQRFTFADGDRVTARFTDAPNDEVQITVIREGDEIGTIAMRMPTPDAILCGETCTAMTPKKEGIQLGVRSNPAGYRVGRYFVESSTGVKGGSNIFSSDGDGDYLGYTAPEVDRDLVFRTVWYKDEPKNVNILFSGNGAGSVTSNSQTCTYDCLLSVQIPFLTDFEAVGSAAEGSVFAGWTLSKDFDLTDECKKDNRCLVRWLPDHVDLIAHFTRTAPVRLDVEITGNANGVVTSEPAEIDCGTTCSAEIDPGTTVTLTAAPDAGYRFDSWSGDCAGSADTCTLVMDEQKSVSASFSPATFSLSVAISGDGSGDVQSSPAGILCGISGSDCQFDFTAGTDVSLTLIASAGSQFGQWGGACAGQTDCILTMDADKSVSAEFILRDAALEIDPSTPFAVTMIPNGAPSPGFAVYTLRNTGGQVLDVEVQSSIQWLIPSFAQKTIAAGESVELRLDLQTAFLPKVPGQYPHSVTLNPSFGELQTITVNLEVQTVEQIPANDNLVKAYVLRGSMGSIRATNVNATAETGEPVHAGVGTASVWWKWKPEISGTFEFSTAGSAIDTALAVYTGEQFSELVQVAANDNDAGATSSRISFEVLADELYLIAVGGNGGETGEITLSFGPADAPENDQFALAQELVDADGYVRGYNANAGLETDEPVHTPLGGASVWYYLDAITNADIMLDSEGSQFDTVVAVYSGNAVNALTRIASNDNRANDGPVPASSVSKKARTSRVTFPTTNGQRYYIAVDGVDGSTGDLRLSWRVGEPGAWIGPAILPLARSVQVGDTATIFAAVVADGRGTARQCRIVSPGDFQGEFHFQTTDKATNFLIGTPNTPVDIEAGTYKTFVISVRPGTTFQELALELAFRCRNAETGNSAAGLSQFVLSSSKDVPADVVSISAVKDADGRLYVPLGSIEAFSIAGINIGAAEQVTVSVEATNPPLPLSITICETNSETGACLVDPSADVIADFNAGQVRTFAVWVTSNGESLAFSPGINRILVRFEGANGTVGATSVSVETVQ